ncbi:MAG: ribonuclease D [Syntrophobacterales bacterium]|nr:ribonuclease D [Syntrophobacterales bacterium]
MDNSWTLVDNRQKLESAQSDILSARHIGIDTEYDSFRYFREKLCLIQICTESHAYIFDPLLDLDISFLGDVFADAATIKIIHACDNDIRLLNRDYGFRFNNIFDTYRAASILGSTALSLTSIVREHLGVELKKTKKLQRSRWDIRPLTNEQLDYAALDTRYLTGLYSCLKESLTCHNLKEEADVIFEKMAGVRWSEKTFHPEGVSRIDGYNNLKDFQRHRLKTLYRWRFETAKRTNTAAFLVLSDRDIMNMSRKNGQAIKSLSEAGIISTAKLKTFGPELIEILRKTMKTAS